jgi:hypothetical protein
MDKKSEDVDLKFSEESFKYLDFAKAEIDILKSEQSKRIDEVISNLRNVIINQLKMYSKSSYKKNQVLSQVDEVLRVYSNELNGILNLYNKSIVMQMTRIADLQIKICLIDFDESININNADNRKLYFDAKKRECIEVINKCNSNISSIKEKKEDCLNYLLEDGNFELEKVKESKFFQRFFEVVLTKIVGYRRVINYILEPLKSKIEKIKLKVSELEANIELFSKKYCLEIDNMIKNIPNVAIEEYLKVISIKNDEVESIYLVDKIKNFADAGIVSSLTFSKDKEKRFDISSVKNIDADLYEKFMKNFKESYSSAIRKFEVNHLKKSNEILIIKNIFEKIANNAKTTRVGLV